jgi:hypothetical protein
MRMLLPLLLGLLFTAAAPAARDCTVQVDSGNRDALFTRLARKQLTLEYGGSNAPLGDIRWQTVGPDLYRVEADTEIIKPGAANKSELHLTGWLTSCGTLLIRRHTWLADGTLAVPYFSDTQLPGRGLVRGKADAPLQMMVFIDSRCPQCHRLLSYAEPLIAAGKLRVELRQIAYLESATEALNDTQLHQAIWLVGKQGSMGDAEYLELVGGFPSDEPVASDKPGYQVAMHWLTQQTELAQKQLNITATPLVLIRDPASGRYRAAGYWEVNRLLLPGS